MNKSVIWLSSQSYPQFSKDLSYAFEQLGHVCKRLTDTTRLDTLPDPDYLFSFEIDEELQAIGHELNVPHGVWYIDKLMNYSYMTQANLENIILFFTYRGDCDFPFSSDPLEIHYLPIAPSIDNHCVPEFNESFDYNVSFVGSPLLEHGNDFPDFCDQLTRSAERGDFDPEFKEELFQAFESILNTQQRYTRQNTCRVTNLVKRQLSDVEFELNDQVINPTVLSFLIGKEAASRQRRMIMKELENVEIFGREEWEDVSLDQNRYHGPVDLRTESPEVFANSKINLNIQRIYALDGLSDRVFNVMRSGGFLLTNHIPVMEELFEPGVHYDRYRTVNELKEKIDYYLTHESERLDIARNGQREVRKNHSIVERTKQLLKKLPE
ncbi:MAG: glycosyltransferase [bacterium]